MFTRISFSQRLDFLTWCLEKEGIVTLPFETPSIPSNHPNLDAAAWLSSFNQTCERDPCNFFYPQDFTSIKGRQLLESYRPLGAARFINFQAYTKLCQDGRFGKIRRVTSAFNAEKIESIGLIHWHQPIHYLHAKTLVVGADLADFDFSRIDAYLQVLVTKPEFRHVGYFTCIKTRMTDLAILKQAIQQLGLTVIENGIAEANQTFMPCDLVLKLEGHYDIGWKLVDGTIAMYWDLSGINLTQDSTQLFADITKQYLALQ